MQLASICVFGSLIGIVFTSIFFILLFRVLNKATQNLLQVDTEQQAIRVVPALLLFARNVNTGQNHGNSQQCVRIV